MSIRNTRPDPRRVRRQRPVSNSTGNYKPSDSAVPAALRFLTHRAVFIGLGVFFAVGIVLGLMGGILLPGGTAGGPMQANEAPDVPRDQVVATGTAEASVSPTPAIKRYTTAPELTIDPNKSYTATIKTTQGDIVVDLDPASNIEAVNAFIFLARDQYYDGTVFMQVNPEAPQFTAQAGDPTQTGLGTPGFNVSEVPTNNPFVRGAFGYASGQFYISYGDYPALNGKETIIGTVTSGLDVLDKLTLLNIKDRGTGADEVQSIEISES